MNKISFIVPIAPWDDTRSQLLFKSLNKYFLPEDIDMVYITFLDKEKMKRQLQELKLKFPFEVMTEEDLIPPKDYHVFKKRKGWIRQQIVKLYISTLVKTEYYLCLDADLICIKPTGFNDLIKNGKPGINIEPKAWHSDWWKASKKVLKIPDPGTTVGMSSSTNIFITGVALDLVKYIENIYKKSFTKVLMNWWWTNTYMFKREWTEYKLYWLFIEYKELTKRYDPDNKIWARSIWKNTKDINEELFKTIFSNQNDGYFSICQSTRIEYDLIAQYAKKYLDI
jgi:hypothetical protein